MTRGRVAAAAGVTVAAAGAVMIAALAGTPASAHHVGVYTARDNAISANFKQI